MRLDSVMVLRYFYEWCSMSPRFSFPLFSVSLAALSLAGTLVGAHADDTVEAWRLFVSDQEAGKVTAIDVETGKTLGVFPLKGYATHLVPSDSGATVFAVQMDHDAVDVLKSGVHLTDHGEHKDVELEDPALLPVRQEGGRPVHAVMHGDEILQFFDRDGEARVLSEKALLEGKTEYDVVKVAAPHHGVAVPMGKYTLVSEPNLDVETKEGELPPRLGLKVLDAEGKQAGEVAACTGLHGEASSAGLVAFGCEEGVLVVRPNDDKAPVPEMIAYGDEMPEGRVGTLLGGKAMQFFLGNYGDDKVVIIEPASEEPYRVVEFPVRRVDFALDPAKVKLAYVFTEDGHLHVLDVLTGKILRSASITEPYSKDGHWRDPRPRLAVMGESIAVSDPRKGLVRILDADSLKETRTIPVEGLPFNVVAVGGSGIRH